MNYTASSRDNVYNPGQPGKLLSIEKYEEETDKTFVFPDIISLHVDKDTETG